MRKQLEIEAVVDALHARRGVAVAALQVIAIEVAHRDGCARVAELAPQVVGMDGIVKDVLGVRREGVGNLGEVARQPRGGRGRRGEVRMQVLDPALPHGARDQRALVHRVRVLALRRFHRLPEPGEGGRGGIECCPEIRGFHAMVGDVLHRRADARDRFLKVRVVRRHDGKHFDLEPRRLMRRDLRHDERLGVARIALDHVSDARRSPRPRRPRFPQRLPPVRQHRSPS